ncbi:unnamed protein product [Brachionus calyciflorus]|uniref:OFD1 n=1 Tax=Brachionus calyciflorus TaxID=104777 RepID=A0A813VJF2_9BILA|nr:unnamed protein product [Brachionus calyciflorus]
MSVDSRDTSLDYSHTNRSIFNNSKKSPSKQHHKDGLTSEELKNKLLQVVKNKGIFDSMKSQLRNKLVLELNPNIDQIRTKAAEHSAIHKSRSNLALSTINCLLINHLKSHEYDYTLSVFMPECGINLNDVYSLNDILHILKISEKSKLYSGLINNNVIKSKGLLWYLVNYFCSHYVTNEVSTQTDYDGVHNIASNLGLKLKNVDQFYSEKSEVFGNKLSFEDKIVNYQKKLEEKAKVEFNQKMSEFKEIELARMRVEVREKMRQEITAYRHDLESSYRQRNEMLNQREQSLEELFKQKKELEEREIFLQRQKLLDEIKNLRDQEAQFKKSFEAQGKLLQIDANKYEKLDEDLKRREERLRLSEKDLDMKLRDEKEKIKLDIERSYAQREFILQSIEAKNKQDATQNEIEKSHLDRIRHEYQLQQIKINEMDLELQKVSGEAVCLKQENELLKEKLSHCMDYDFIVQENRMLKHKLELSKELIGEKNLTSRRSKSILSSREPPQRKRSVTFEDQGNHIPPLNLKLNEDMSVMDTERAADDVFDEKSRQSYREEGEKILDDALERLEIKDKLEDHALINEELRDLYEMQVYEQRKLYDVINEVKKEVEFIHYGVKVADDLVPNKLENKISFSFLDSAKDRLKYLEGENEKIEQTYRDYQHKIKSKYYPINDDESKEIRIVGKEKKEFNRIDVEKFLESTLKANLNARVLRDELEEEVEKFKKEKQIREIKEPNFAKIDHLIKDVNLPGLTNLEMVKQNLKNEETELKLFQERTRKRIESSDDESSRIVRQVIQTNRSSFIEDDKTLDSESRSETSTRRSSPVKNFGLNDYVQMFDRKNEDIKEESVKNDFTDDEFINKKTSRIKIEYSDSKSESSDNEKNVSIGNKRNDIKKNNNDDEDDDFDW